MWEHVVQGLIGETFDYTGKELCGARVVHKKTKGRNGGPNYRIEIWFQNSNQNELIEKTKSSLLQKFSFLSDASKDTKIANHNATW